MTNAQKVLAKFEEMKAMGMAEEIKHNEIMATGKRVILIKLNKAQDVIYREGEETVKIVGGKRHGENVTAAWIKEEPKEDNGFQELKKTLTKAFMI